MFGIFKKQPNRLDRLQAVMELNTEFSRLQKDAPAAAWFFARNLHNARPLIELDAPVADKLAHLHNELKSNNTAISSNADAGMSGFALQILAGYMKAVGNRENVMMWAATLKAIMRHGERYRDLGPADSRVPTEAKSRIILKNGGYDTLAELIAAVESELNEKETDPDVAAENVQTLLASFDIREEASSGRLWPHIEKLQDIVTRV